MCQLFDHIWLPLGLCAPYADFISMMWKVPEVHAGQV